MIKNFKRIFFAGICTIMLFFMGATSADKRGEKSVIMLADPTVFYHDGTYYLYGTGGNKRTDQGFVVYTSKDKKNWKGPVGANNGYALKKGDAFGEAGFWAPQVLHHNDKFYLFYTASEHIAVAVSDSPLGPFVQKEKKPFIQRRRNIDPFVFIDDDGKKYLYHVIVANGGNRIFVAELEDDLSGIRRQTLTQCIEAEDTWENIEQAKWSVIEGPTVIKQGEWYYMIYSANHFRSPDYAVGYAMSKSPIGPWKKYDGNPVLSRHNTGHNGSGHGDLFQDKKGNWSYVFHTHSSDERIAPRKTALVRAAFVPDTNGTKKFILDARSFQFLYSR